jgi:1,2-diacylglycerol 3-alpha-glucosyltransferase
MRILMVSHGYPPILSGVTLVVQKIARTMVQKGHDVTVVTASDRRLAYRDEDEGVHLVRVRSLHNPFWKEGRVPIIGQKGLTAVADQVQPDILHAHDAGLVGLQLLRLGKRTGIPLISTCYYVPRFVARYLSWRDRPWRLVESLMWAYSIWLFNKIDHVVFATAAHRDAFLQNGLDVPTTIISNGVDTERYHPPAGRHERVEARYGLPPRPRILFVGRLALDKEIDVLIRAMRIVCAWQKAHLIVVGRGDARPRLEELAAELGLQPFVHFIGYVPEADLPALYRAVDLFAITSKCEVQSLPTLQAVATGLPVVAADAMALPELVHHERNGFLVQPDDPQATAEAILAIMRDPDLASRMGQASLPIARPHTESHTFDLYEALYRRMIRGPRAGRADRPCLGTR